MQTTITALAAAGELSTIEGIALIIGIIMLLALPLVFLVAAVIALLKRSASWGICAATALIGSFALFAVLVASFRDEFEVLSERYQAGLASEDADGYFVAIDQSCRIKAPKAWKPLNLGGPDAVIQAGDVLEACFLMVVPDNKSTEVMDLYLELVEEQARHNFGNPNLRIQNVEAVTINGISGRRFSFETIIQGQRQWFLMTVLEYSDRYYRLVAWCDARRKEEFREPFQQIFETFERLETTMDRAAETGGKASL